MKSLYLGSILRLVAPSMLELSCCLVSRSTVSFRSWVVTVRGSSLNTT